MRSIARILIVAIGVIVIIAGAATAIGYFLPVDHAAIRTAVIPAPHDSVWKTITDVASYPSWRSDVEKVEAFESHSGRSGWREVSGGDVIPMEIMTSTPPSLLVVRIASDSLPFGGTWNYMLKPEGPGTRVTIWEQGRVYNPIFRFVARYIIGHTSTMDDYLRALGSKYGAEIKPVDGVLEIK